MRKIIEKWNSDKNKLLTKKCVFVDSRKFAGSHRSGGFVVLYTVLIATIILAITIGIALIAYNQVILSSSVAEGGEAFFAADSGAECALYWDRNIGAFDSQTPPFFSCDENSISSTLFPQLWSDGKDGFQLNLKPDENGAPQNCARVTVEKEVEIDTDSEGNPISGTRIISLGYNVSCTKLDEADLPGGQLPPRTIQRAIRVTY